MKGFISLHRKLKDNPIWADPNYLKLWIYCLFEASHKDREQLVGNEVISLKRGQFITGRSVLSEEMNRGVKPKQRLNNRTWFRYLQNLEAWGMLTIKSTNKYSVVTIDKYDVYQLSSNEIDQASDQQMSNDCPSTDQQMSTNNNVNNVNNYINNTTTTTHEEKSDAIVFYQNNIGVIRPQIAEEILDWINDFGDEMVIEALNRSVARNKPSWGYAKSILKSWQNKNIKTIEQAKAEEIEFQNQQQAKRQPYKYNQPKKEILPDWFKERDQAEKPKEDDTEQMDEAELTALLQKHTGG